MVTRAIPSSITHFTNCLSIRASFHGYSFWIISKLVEGQRTGTSEISSDSRGPLFNSGTDWIDHYKSGKVMSREFTNWNADERGYHRGWNFKGKNGRPARLISTLIMLKRFWSVAFKSRCPLGNLRNLRNLRINRGWILFSGPVPSAGLFFGGQLKGTGGGFFAAAGAADIEVFQVCGQGNFRLQEALLERKSAGAEEFGFKHGSCVPAKK
jgi:hypothetical protein